MGYHSITMIFWLDYFLNYIPLFSIWSQLIVGITIDDSSKITSERAISDQGSLDGLKSIKFGPDSLNQRIKQWFLDFHDIPWYDSTLLNLSSQSPNYKLFSLDFPLIWNHTVNLNPPFSLIFSFIYLSVSWKSADVGSVLLIFYTFFCD